MPSVPAGSGEVLEITNGIGAGFTTRLNALVGVCGVGEQESVARSVKLKVPGAVGVPARRPEEASVKPAGNAPLATVQAIGAIPPLDASWKLYA